MPRHSSQGVKPADLELDKGRQRDFLRPFGVPRWLGAGLYVVFSVLLLLPLVRRLRRRAWWNVVRALLVAGGLALILKGWWAGALLIAAGAFLKRAADPDVERKLQRKHRAEYLLNGGAWAGGELPHTEPLDPRSTLYLLLRERHLLIVPARAGEVHSAADVGAISEVLVDGAIYRPIYVSEAKDPPVREASVDRSASSVLELRFADGKHWRFRYQGPFHKHLAETAAHAIHSVRETVRNPYAARAGREFPVLGR